MDKDSKSFITEKKTLKAMISIYCRGSHEQHEGLCESCGELLDYALGKLGKCSFGAEKPKCSQCPIHCYKPAMRQKVKDVMRYAGPRMIHKHPVLAAKHILHGVKHRKLPSP